MQLTNERRSPVPVVLMADGVGKPGGGSEGSSGHGRAPLSRGEGACGPPRQSWAGTISPLGPSQGAVGISACPIPIPVCSQAPSPAGILVCLVGYHPSFSSSWETAGTLLLARLMGLHSGYSPSPSRFCGLPEDRGVRGLRGWVLAWGGITLQTPGLQAGKLRPGEMGGSVGLWSQLAQSCSGTRAPQVTGLGSVHVPVLSLTDRGRTKTDPRQDAGDPAPSRHSGGACPSAFVGSLTPASPQTGCLAGLQRGLH